VYQYLGVVGKREFERGNSGSKRSIAVAGA